MAAVWVAIGIVREVGPLDRAKLQGFLAVPMTLLVPAVTGRAASRIDGRWAWVVVIGVAVLAGFCVLVPGWVTYSANCAAASLPMPVVELIGGFLLTIAVTAAASAVTWRAWPASVMARGQVVVAVVVGGLTLAAGAAVLLALATFALFLNFTCVVRPGGIG